MIVAVNGMLSTTPDPSAETQVIPSISAVRSPPVRSATASATSPIAPVSSSAPTITNRPRKKNRVGHSIPARAPSSDWRLVNSIAVAPASATVAGSGWSAL
jgi:hypothetical protein